MKAIMNLFLLPMWFLSGALFPAEGARGGLAWVMRANPLTYGLSAIRCSLYLRPGHELALTVGFAVSIIFAILMFALASVIVTGRVSADLQ